MDKKQVELLQSKTKEELINIIIGMDNKIFELIKELSTNKVYQGLKINKNLNEFLEAPQ